MNLEPILSNILTSSERDSPAMPDIISEDDSLPGLIDDSDSDDDSDVTIDAFHGDQESTLISGPSVFRLLTSRELTSRTGSWFS
jgi:hypothetical protein